MDHSNADEWELSKENVQPLRQGRSFVQLSAALASNATSVRAQQDDFERELRMYSGDDALAVWIKYISWTEQNFPRGGKDGNCQKLLKHCVVQFKDEVKYQNDPRYIKIWIKFADYTNDPGELYEYLYNNKIGCEVADFYEAWTLWLERCGNTKKADVVFKQGIELTAQPIDRLIKRHSEFQARVARSAFESMTASDEQGGNLSQRTKLRGLKPHDRTGLAHTVRTGSTERHVLPRSGEQTTSTTFQVYNDENAITSQLIPQNHEFLNVPLPEVTSRENQQKLSKWTDVRVKQKSVSAAGTSHAPAFDCYEDEGVQQPLITPHKIADGTGILSVRSKPLVSHLLDGVTCNVNNPNEKIMYCKDKIYAGIKEFSFEELRMVFWLKKKRQEAELEVKVNAKVEQILQERLDVERKKLRDEMQSMLLSSQFKPESNRDSLHLNDESHITIKGGMMMNLSEAAACLNIESGNVSHMKNVKETGSHLQSSTIIKSNHQRTNECLNIKTPSQITDFEKKTTGDISHTKASSYNLRGAAPVSGLHKSLFEPKDHHDSTGSIPNIIDMTQPSPTVHTKEAYKMIYGMFNEPDLHLGQTHVVPAADDDFEKQFFMDSAENKVPFKIYQDPVSVSCTSLHEPIAPKQVEMIIYEDLCPVKTMDHKNKKIADVASTAATAVKENVVGRQLLMESVVQLPRNRTISESADKENMVDPCSHQPLGGRMRIPSLFKKDHIQTFPLESDHPRFNHCSNGLIAEDSDLDCCVDDQAEDINMPDTDEWCIDAFDPNEEIVFEPKESSTENLTQLVRHAAASHFPVQPTSRNNADDIIGFMQNKDVPSKIILKCNHRASETQKSGETFFFYDHVDQPMVNRLDTIQESSENKSRMSSLVSSSRSGSSGSRSSHSSCYSANKLSKTSVYSAASTSVADIGQNAVVASNPDILSIPQEQRVIDKFAQLLPFSSREPDDCDDKDPMPKINCCDEESMNFNDKHPTISDEEEEKEDSNNDIDEFTARHLNASIINHTNPFKDSQIQTFLKRLDPPLIEYRNYHETQKLLPKFAVRSSVRIGDKDYIIKSKLGEGGYARVYHMIDKNASQEDDGIVAKVQKPSCPWEFYITTELHKRLSQLHMHIDVSSSIMSIDEGFFFTDGSCFFNKRHEHGTLLDFVNMFKVEKKSIPEWLAVYLSLELFNIVEQLHKCKIIHGDFKPDNILIRQFRRLREGETVEDLIRGSTSSLKLIDFGQSIDVTMFPPKIQFLSSTSTEGFQCPEMLSKRPWTYQPDIFGLAATIYVILVGNYMKFQQAANVWSTTFYPRRSWKTKMFWKSIFRDFLNVVDCSSIPDLANYRRQLEIVFLESVTLTEYNDFVDEIETMYSKVQK